MAIKNVMARENFKSKHYLCTLNILDDSMTGLNI